MSGQEHKLIVSGTMGAGKTTAVGAISEIEVVSTEATNNENAAGVFKASTTVAMDYGELALPNGDRLRLYGTPGQRRFDFMWRVLGQGALGVILLLDNSRPDPVADLVEYLAVFKPLASHGRMVIGIGRSDQYHAPAVDDYQTILMEQRLIIPVISVDVRRRMDVLLLVEVLLDNIESGYNPVPT